MLVLTRRVGEEVVIAGNICVTLLGIKGNQVRLGITAPYSVPIARGELLAESDGKQPESSAAPTE